MRSSDVVRALMPLSIRLAHSKLNNQDEPSESDSIDNNDPLTQKFRKKAITRRIDNKVEKEQEHQANWKKLFQKKLEKTLKKRQFDTMGCRPGWFCHTAKQTCQLKDCIIKEGDKSAKKIAAKTKNQSVEEFLLERNIQWVVDQVLQNYEYLRSLNYSDRKITHLVKSYCQSDRALLYVFLRADDRQQSVKNCPSKYIKDKDTIICNIVMVASNEKSTQEVEDFYYDVKEYKSRLELDVVQRGRVIARMMGSGIVQTKLELKKHFKLAAREKR